MLNKLELTRHYPYIPGQTLTLLLKDGQAMDVSVMSVFEPFTLSCVALVHSGSPPFEGLYVVKLYDRCFATDLREQESIPIWTTDFEAEYSQFIRRDCAPEFFDLCTKVFREALDWADEEQIEAWDKGRQEAYLQCLCRQVYNTESYACDLLHDIQGIHVPRLFARVFLQTSDKPNEDLDCPGFLLEFINGFQLANLAENAARILGSAFARMPLRLYT